MKKALAAATTGLVLAGSLVLSAGTASAHCYNEAFPEDIHVGTVAGVDLGTDNLGPDGELEPVVCFGEAGVGAYVDIDDQEAGLIVCNSGGCDRIPIG